MFELVSEVNGEVKTTSLKVAEFFNKHHKDVLRSIRNLDCSDEFKQRNFAPCLNTNDLRQGGKKSEHYSITKDGFVFLAMGFRGKKAAQFKESYINAFNSMASELFNNKVNKLESITRSLEAACIQKDSHILHMVNTMAPVDPEGTISEINGNPRVHLVHSYYRTDKKHLERSSSDFFEDK